MPRARCNERIIEELAEELGFSIKEIEEVVKAQSDLTFNTMSQGTFDSIVYPNMGIFKVRMHKLQQINENNGRAV